MNETAPPQLRDIAPPIDVFPYPMWMVVVAVFVALIVLGLLGWLAWRLIARRKAVPPPTPRETAMLQLERLRPAIADTEPRTFSGEVSNVLRTYLTRQFGLRATKQTSPEFLASIADFSLFEQERKDLLARFLQKCDLIKFARLDAGAPESEQLLEQAILFVKGSESEIALPSPPSAHHVAQ